MLEPADVALQQQIVGERLRAPAIGASRCFGKRAAATRSHQRHQNTANSDAPMLPTVKRLSQRTQRPGPPAQTSSDAAPWVSRSASASFTSAARSE